MSTGFKTYKNVDIFVQDGIPAGDVDAIAEALAIGAKSNYTEDDRAAICRFFKDAKAGSLTIKQAIEAFKGVREEKGSQPSQAGRSVGFTQPATPKQTEYEGQSQSMQDLTVSDAVMRAIRDELRDAAQYAQTRQLVRDLTAGRRSPQNPMEMAILQQSMQILAPVYEDRQSFLKIEGESVTIDLGEVEQVNLDDAFERSVVHSIRLADFAPAALPAAY